MALSYKQHKRYTLKGIPQDRTKFFEDLVNAYYSDGEYYFRMNFLLSCWSTSQLTNNKLNVWLLCDRNSQIVNENYSQPCFLVSSAHGHNSLLCSFIKYMEEKK